MTEFIPFLAVLLFLGALFWAKAQDPFSRRWFTVLADGHRLNCVAVLPKPVRPCPVVIYSHGSGGSLMNDGFELRQMAETSLAVVSLEYDQTNEAAFPQEMEAVLRYVGRQKWADTNAVAWVGFSVGADRQLEFAWQHPEQRPNLLVQLSGSGLNPSSIFHPPSSILKCPMLLIHGDQDEIFPVTDTRSLAVVLQTNGAGAELKIIPGASHGMDPDQGVIFRGIGEYCLTHLIGKDWWQKYHSIARFEAEAPPFWLFCLPAAAWAVGGLIRSRIRHPAPAEKVRLQRHEIALRWLAAILAVWASADTALHLVPPHFAVSDKTLAIARRILVQPKERADFEALACQPIWKEQKLNTLLDHVELAGYNRELINWQLDQKIYEDFVLSPVITGQAGEQLNWRRALWEECYPRIRHETSPEDAARIVVRHLRERVTVIKETGLPQAVPDIWLRQLTNPAGFEILYVAALRSVGVPARLDAGGQAEIYTGEKWQAAPRPVIYEAF